MKKKARDLREYWAIVKADGKFMADRCGVLLWGVKREAAQCVEDGARLARVRVTVREAKS